MKKLIAIIIVLTLVALVIGQLGSFVRAEISKSADRYENYMEMTD